MYFDDALERTVGVVLWLRLLIMQQVCTFQLSFAMVRLNWAENKLLGHGTRDHTCRIKILFTFGYV